MRGRPPKNKTTVEIEAPPGALHGYTIPHPSEIQKLDTFHELYAGWNLFSNMAKDEETQPESVEWIRNQLLPEYERLMVQKDIRFALSRYLIKDKTTGKTMQFGDIGPNPGQEAILAPLIKQYELKKACRIKLVKARQFGGSTLCVMWLYLMTKMNPGQNGLIITHEQKLSKKLWDTLLRIYETDKYALDAGRPDKDRASCSASTGDFQYPNDLGGGLITIGSGWKDRQTAGYDYHHVLCSEVESWRDADSVMQALLSTLPEIYPSTCIFECTPLEAGSWFHNEYRAHDEYTPIFVGWQHEPRYSKPFNHQFDKDVFEKSLTDEEFTLKNRLTLSSEQLHWRRNKLESPQFRRNPAAFKSEYPSDAEEGFISGGTSPFAGMVVRQWEYAKERKERGPIYRFHLAPLIDTQWAGRDEGFELSPDGIFHEYSPPDRTGATQYLLTVDVAQGIDRNSSKGRPEPDYSVIDVWARHQNQQEGDFIWTRRLEQAGQIIIRCDADILADYCIRLSHHYNCARMAIENAQHGRTVIERIRNLKEEYLLIAPYPVMEDDSIPGMFREDKRRAHTGWETNKRTKPLMFDALVTVLRENTIKIYSEDTLNQLATVIRTNNGSFEAKPGCHDDAVITASIAALIFESPFVYPLSRSNLLILQDAKTKSFKDGMQEARRVGIGDGIKINDVDYVVVG